MYSANRDKCEGFTDIPYDLFSFTFVALVFLYNTGNITFSFLSQITVCSDKK